MHILVFVYPIKQFRNMTIQVINAFRIYSNMPSVSVTKFLRNEDLYLTIDVFVCICFACLGIRNMIIIYTKNSL